MGKNNNALESCVGIFTIFAGTIIISSIMNGWALSKLWIWFIVPIFEWPILSIVQAIGLGMVVSFLTRYSVKESDAAKDIGSLIAFALSNAILYPLLTVGLGYIVTLFL